MGPVPIPVPPVIADFPLRVDYGTAEELEPQSFIHRFDAPGLRTEQRFWRGTGQRRFRIRRASLNCLEYERLRDHWNLARGVHASFKYSHPHHDGTSVDVMVHYSDTVLRFEHLVAMATGDPGIILVEAVDSSVTPSYGVIRVDDGIPSLAELDSLRKTEQELIPVVVIQPRGSGALRLSDRNVTIGANLYIARLLDWSGLAWSTDQNSDSATFRFANADGVWTEYFKQISLKRAALNFGVFDVTTTVMMALWTGTIREWTRDPASRIIDIRANDGPYELTLPYPTRLVSRRCWKEFKSDWCPYEGSLTTCDKSWEQCVERGMTKYFGGQKVNPQQVRVRDNSTGTWGWGRSQLKSVSIAEDSIYQRVVQEIYTDLPMKVNCDVATGRDESEFYSALGIVGEGPITGFSTDLTKHLLDDAPPHDPQKGGGWRYSTGADPAVNSEFFGLSQAPWGSVPPGSTFAAGTAFAEIRRTDAKGLQLSKVSDRKMTVLVTGGRGGWTWTAPGSRFWTQPLTNAVWIAVNAYLRGIGLKSDHTRPDLITVAEMEQYLRIDRLVEAAALCDMEVPKLVGAGTERQFTWRGIVREQKPLRDWLIEFLTCCLGYSYIVNGKLAIGVRVNSSVLAGNAFTQATVLESSFTAQPREAQFNHLTAEFADEEFDWALNSVQVYDIDHARIEGSVTGPRFRTNRMPLSGVTGKSQASRLVITRLKEELGGATLAEQEASRNVSFRSTVIALNTMPGDVCSFDDPGLPGGRLEFRIRSRTLNPDWSMDFEGVPSADSMYDVVAGPKPDDIPADPVPPERFQSPQGIAWMPNELAPFSDDPLLVETERTFGLWQDYAVGRQGEWQAALGARGELTVNRFQGYQPPMIYNVTFAQGGGYLAGGQAWYVAMAHRDAGGKYSPLSNVVAVWIPPNSTGHLTINSIVPAEGLTGWAVWLGPDIRRMALQAEDGVAPMPSSLVLDHHDVLTSSLPWAEAKQVRIKAKQVLHSGVAGLLVQEVIGTNQIRSSEWIGSTDTWVGQYLSVLADWSDGSVPLWNFTITGFDSSTGTMTVQPDCVRATPEDSVEPGDVMVVRAKVTAASADTVTCALWQNSIAQAQFGTDGLDPEEEVGQLVRVLHGRGAGQTRLCTAATQNSHTVDPPWDVVPDTTSMIIVEDPEWMYTSETAAQPVDAAGQKVDIILQIPNLANWVVLVGGFLVDNEGLETIERFAVVREIYIFGEPPTVREVLGPVDEQQAGEEDHVIRVAGAEGSPLILPPLAQYSGRTLLVWNDGPGDAVVRCAEGDQMHDGSVEVTLKEKQTLRITSA